MRLLKPASQTRKCFKAATRSLGWVMALGFALAPQARASFIDYYDFSNFTVSSTSDGFAFTPDAGVTLEVIGGNDGSGVPGTTTALITAPTSGTVQFNYQYNSLDSPTFDSAGYVLNGVFSQFADTDGENGAISFAVNSGDSFGFEVWTADNTGEPGILAVTNFNAPEGANTSVPEPGTVSLFLLAAIAGALYLRTRRGATHEGNA